MTDEELDRMELLWRRRVRIRDIANELGYSACRISQVASENRYRFPNRRHKVDSKRMEVWVERILAGRATIGDATRDMGVSRETVRKRLHERKA